MLIISQVCYVWMKDVGEWNEMIIREWKRMEWNKMYLSKGKEWNGMELSNLDWMF